MVQVGSLYVKPITPLDSNPLNHLDAQCPNMKFAAAQHKDGTLQGYYQLPADLCYKLPDVSSYC